MNKALSAKTMKKFYNNLLMKNPKLSISRKPLDESLQKMSKKMWKKYKQFPKI